MTVHLYTEKHEEIWGKERQKKASYLVCKMLEE